MKIANTYQVGDLVEVILTEDYSSDTEVVGTYSLTKKKQKPCIRFLWDTYIEIPTGGKRRYTYANGLPLDNSAVLFHNKTPLKRKSILILNQKYK